LLNTPTDALPLTVQGAPVSDTSGACAAMVVPFAPVNVSETIV
jgi:hypothetical protein